MLRSSRRTRAQIEVLLGAVAFAASVPAGKLLLAQSPPLAVSGGFYVAAGLCCAALLAFEPRHPSAAQTHLRGAEWGWLAGAIAAGGVLGPLAMLQGLRWTNGYTAGLLLNFEAVFTVGLGMLISNERLGGRGLPGIALILAGAVALSAGGGAAAGATRPLGALLVVAACACWGLDNNLTQRISLRDARQIVALKGLIGGAVSLGLAAATGQLGHWTVASTLGMAVVGAVSYGLSIVLFIRGLRDLGVMYTGALFALAPGFAAVLSWLVLREPLAPLGLGALGVMTGGALLLATDRHDHAHTHEAIEHTHEHDEHHQHEHLPGELERVPHVHPHRHEPLTHAHAHAHDVHHRHGH